MGATITCFVQVKEEVVLSVEKVLEIVSVNTPHTLST